MKYNPEIDLTIIGRKNADVGIGKHTDSFFHCLKKRVFFNFINTRKSGQASDNTIHLSNFLGNLENYPNLEGEYGNVSIFTDVLWNGVGDFSYTQIPDSPVKLAFTTFDSDKIPGEWKDIIQDRLDGIVVPTEEVKKIYLNSGVQKPIFVLPLALDLRAFQVVKDVGHFSQRPFRFGSISSFHRRKNHQSLIEGFLDAFGPHHPGVQLVIHSNLNYNNEYERLVKLVKDSGASNVILSCYPLSKLDYLNLLNSLDVYCLISAGEGYSIAPREALSLGKACLLSANSGHDSLIRSGFCMGLKSQLPRPAVYDEIDGRVFGLQFQPYHVDIVNKLREIYNKRETLKQESLARKEYSSQFDISRLRYDYKTLCKPSEVILGDKNEISGEILTTDSEELYKKYNSFIADRKTLFVRKPKQITRKVIMAHDGGFFSVFNIYFSHLVWYSKQKAIQHVLPDWRIDSMARYWKTDKFTSFCYGSRQDGNIWLKLFSAPYQDLPEETYQKDDLLYEGSEGAYHSWNSDNEPLLTYIHAYELYRQPDFKEWRRWYHYYYQKHIQVNPTIQSKVNQVFKSQLEGYYTIGMHVRHPSHAIEQPDQKIAHFDKYILNAWKIVRKKERQVGSDWKVFLATDQERVVKYFREEFGDKLVTLDGIARTSEDQDNEFESLSKKDQMREGFQIQHRMAADQSRWSYELAEQVIIDASLLAKCNAFVHSTSNIATAVSFMSPEVEMVYCK